jgi:hypothetical protein
MTPRQWRNRADECVAAKAMREKTYRQMAHNIARDYDRQIGESSYR